MTHPPAILIAGGGTGGHLMPALALADAIRAAHPEWEITLAGARRGVEAEVLPHRSFPYVLLPAEPIYRRRVWRNLRWPFLAVRLIREVDALLDRVRPALTLGTGGYASGPVVWRAARRGIPTAIQEQNAYPGIATRLLARRVRQIHLGVPEALRYLSPGRDTAVHLTGNPIAPPDPGRREIGLRRFGLEGRRPVLLVTGGSQGARAINELVASWVEGGGAEEVDLLWLTGTTTWERYARFHAPPHRHVIDFLDPMADALAVADLALSRAGMMTIAELCAWGIPSLLVPLPTAAADHQTPNARVMAEAGAAVNLPQEGLTSERVGRELARLLGDAPTRHRMAQAARARGKPDAARTILEHLENLL